MIELYTAPTPNGYKVSVMLEETGLPYKVHEVNILDGDQHKADFRAINPNGKIPAIIDREAGDFAVFESGAILIYLAEKTGLLLPTDRQGRSTVMQWLMLQMGGIGPMMGQANVFYRYFPEKIPAVIDRYQKEVRRLFVVLDQRLGEQPFLAGSDYSIADIAHWCWVRTYKWSGVSVADLPHLQRWLEAIARRPAVDRGCKVPFDISELMQGDNANADKLARNARNIVTGLND